MQPELDKTGAAIVRAQDVRYLVFGGGGGRGWAHLGVLAALEDLTGRRPFVSANAPPRRRGAQPETVRGVAGASVGAFVAMCAALGATSRDLTRFAEGTFGRNRLTLASPKTDRDVVPRLLDDENWFFKEIGARIPASGVLSNAAAGALGAYLAAPPVVENGRFSAYGRPNPVIFEMMDERYYSESIIELIGSGPLRVMFSEAIDPLAQIENLRQWLDARLRRRDEKRPHLNDLRVFTRNDRLFRLFLANLQGEGGLLAGRALHKAVAAALAHFGRAFVRDPETVTFRELFVERGVELAVTGTHLARRRGELFSYRTTPDFAIAPAVCISMSLPGLFKPISVSLNDQARGLVMPELYVGRWSDGGMVDNLPLRAFPRPGSLALDPRTVAFALGTAIPRASGTTVATNLERLLNEYVGVYVDQPVNNQLELESDDLQVLDLNLALRNGLPLSTLDVAFDRARCHKAAEAARALVTTFFKPLPSHCFSISRRWAVQGRDALSVDFQVFETVARAQFRSFFSVVSPAPLKVIPFVNASRKHHDRGFTVDIVAGMSSDPAGWHLIEAKASGDAELTDPQKEGHPLVGKWGGLLVNHNEDDGDREWAPFGDQTVLPKQEVEVVRPADLCAVFERLVKDAAARP